MQQFKETDSAYKWPPSGKLRNVTMQQIKMTQQAQSVQSSNNFARKLKQYIHFVHYSIQHPASLFFVQWENAEGCG